VICVIFTMHLSLHAVWSDNFSSEAADFCSRDAVRGLFPSSGVRLCLSVTLVLCQNGWAYRKKFYTMW